MFLSIPNTNNNQEENSSNQSAHTVFNIHINGFHHCSLRYSQLRTFYEDFRNLYPSIAETLPDFPPKKIFNLNPTQTNERRVSLERYFQVLAQNNSIVNSLFFIEFFSRAQIDTFLRDASATDQKINLSFRLLNNQEITIENVNAKDGTTDVFDACITKLRLKDDFRSYFALYLYENDDNQLRMIRPLYEFESPYLSLTQAMKMKPNTCLVVKKSYWNPDFDLPLLDDRRARNLLFFQAKYEIEQSQRYYPSEIYQQLHILEESNSTKDYILLARTSRFYGSIFLRDCSILSPIDDSSSPTLKSCWLAVGNNELVCCFEPEQGSRKSVAQKEIAFTVKRIRCWKANVIDNQSHIALEYLIKKNQLKWIQINTKQAALVSSSLQTMVKEILDKRAGATSPQKANPIATIEPKSVQTTNTLPMRKEIENEQFSNDYLFEGADGDDDL